MACVQTAKQLPFSSLALYGPGICQRSRALKTCAINQCLDLIESVMPKDEDLKRPCLEHGDLHEANIFIDPDNSTTITDIIDW